MTTVGDIIARYGSGVAAAERRGRSGALRALLTVKGVGVHEADDLGETLLEAMRQQA